MSASPRRSGGARKPGVVEREKAPERGRGNRRSVARGNHDPPGDGVGRRDDEPAAREPVVLDLRTERVRTGAHGSEERVGREVQHLIGGRGRLREAADAAIGREDELGRAGRAARIRRKRSGLREVGADEVLQQRRWLAGGEFIQERRPALLPRRLAGRSPGTVVSARHVAGGRHRRRQPTQLHAPGGSCVDRSWHSR